MNSVLLVDPLTTALSLVDRIRAKGFRAVALLNQKKEWFERTPCAVQPPYLKDWEQNQFFDETIIENNLDAALVRLRGRESSVVGIIPGHEIAVDAADWLSDQLGLPGNDPALSRARRDKSIMKEKVFEAGLRVAEFRRCHTEDEAETFMFGRDFPVVVKSPVGGGSHNCFICKDLQEVREAFKITTTTYDRLEGIPEYALLEEYIGGTEYVVNLFGNGEELFVTDVWRYRRGASEFGRNLYLDTVLEPIDSAVLKPVRDYAIEASRALGIRFGAVHAEIKFDPKKGPVMIEIGARLGGLKMAAICSQYSNFDTLDALIDVATGKSVEAKKPHFRKSLWILSCVNSNEGTINRINGVEEIQNLSSYDSHFLPIKKGELIEPTKSLWDVPLTVWLAHENRKNLSAEAERARELFSVQTSERTVPRIS